jgi:hypothetical protein
MGGSPNPYALGDALRHRQGCFGATRRIARHHEREDGHLPTADEPSDPGPAQLHSFRATSGPVMRLSRGNVEAMMASEAASPPTTVAQYATPGVLNAMPT